MALSSLRSRVGADLDNTTMPLQEPAPVERYEWHGRFGPMVVEIRDGQAFVNGQAVEPHPKPS